MVERITSDEALFLLTTSRGREIIADALEKPNLLDDYDVRALKSALNHTTLGSNTEAFARAFMLFSPESVGLDHVLTKLFLHRTSTLAQQSSGALIIEKSYETIPAPKAGKFLDEIEGQRGVIRFQVAFSGIEEFKARFIYNMNILARNLFEREEAKLNEGKKEFERSKSEFKRFITKLYAVTRSEDGDIIVFDLSRLRPNQLDVVSHRYGDLRPHATTFYARGPNAVELVKKIAALDPNNRLVFTNISKKGGSGQGGGSEGEGTPEPQQNIGGGKVLSFRGVIRHGAHSAKKSAAMVYGHKPQTPAIADPCAASLPAEAAAISAGMAVPLKIVR